MRSKAAWCLLLPLSLFACGTDVVTGLETGLSGSVTRGPVTPVCQPDIPCSAPFSANFTVWQGSHRVASFHSSAQGEFTVSLEPGEYRVVPGSDAPIIDPAAQIKQVTVGPGTMTVVHLDFDTGLR
jgi:hypothetical protein